MKIVKATSVPTEVLFAFRAYTIGNQRGPLAVVDDDLQAVYVLGDREICESYMESTEGTDSPDLVKQLDPKNLEEIVELLNELKDKYGPAVSTPAEKPSGKLLPFSRKSPASDPNSGS